MKRRIRTWAAVAAVAVSATACGLAAPPQAATRADPVVVYAATSTSEPMEAVIDAYREATGVEVWPTFASSSALGQQLLDGGYAHIFLSANRGWVQALDRADRVARRHDLAGNRMVLIVPQDSTLTLEGPEDLRAPEVAAIGISDPASPAGRYGRELFQEHRLWFTLEPRLIYGSDVRQVLHLVERGDVQAGLVYATDAALSDRVRQAFVFESEHVRPAYRLALLTDGEAHPEAVRLYEHLLTDEVQAVFRRFGFIEAPPPPPDRLDRDWRNR